MTIIVYCAQENRVFVDSRASWSNGRPPASIDKVQTHDWSDDHGDVHSVIYAASGPVTAGTLVLRSALRAIDSGTLEIETRVKEVDNVAVMFSYIGHLWMVESQYGAVGDKTVVFKLAECRTDICSGGGATFYSAYVAAGNSPRDAVLMTASYHTECAHPVKSFGVDGNVGFESAPSGIDCRRNRRSSASKANLDE